MQVQRIVVDDHGAWAYRTVVGEVPEQFRPAGGDGEAAAYGWFTADELLQLPLHPGLAAAWRCQLATEVTISGCAPLSLALDPQRRQYP